MKIRKLILIFPILILTSMIHAQSTLDSMLSDFTYESRKEMKISSEQIANLLLEEHAILVDIRFEEEQAAWQMDYALKMPLPALPQRYTELPKDQLIVTACPHKDRAIIAMVYLRSKGYRTAYLSEGLLGLADYLRGDRAKDFIRKFSH